MANYTTVEQMTKSFKERDLIRLSNEDGQSTTINVSVLNTLIEYVSDRIDAYLRQRYTLPLNPVPQGIQNICNLMTYYELKHRVNDLNETDKYGYQECIRFLEHLAIGKAALPQQSMQECANRTLIAGPNRKFPYSLIDKM